jgi:glycosyltransferase involved in cell wall biosynthesis
MKPAPVRVLHIITGLHTGGAELMLYRLLSRSDRRVFQHEVFSLSGSGPVGERIRSLEIPVFGGEVRRLASVPKMLGALAGHCHRSDPNVVHTWLYHSDLVGGLAAKLFSRAKVIWHLHHKDLVPPLIKPRTRQVARACALLSRSVPDKIVCCSNAAMKTHSEFGYDARRMLAIPNGFDLDEFNPDPSVREETRRRLGIPESFLVIALIARFSPLKDHETFLNSCRRIHQNHPNTVFLLCGDLITAENEILMQWIKRAGIAESCRLLGRQDNVPEILSAADIAVSSSRTEAFPCVVGEAMAMRIPCVVTDVGDSGFLIGDTGRVVPPGDPEALAAACSELIRMNEAERRRLGQRARQRIQREFSLQSFVGKIEMLYRQLWVAGRCIQPGIVTPGTVSET